MIRDVLVDVFKPKILLSINTKHWCREFNGMYSSLSVTLSYVREDILWSEKDSTLIQGKAGAVKQSIVSSLVSA